MTIRTIAYQMHRLSVGGYLNGEKFTVKELEFYIKNHFQKTSHRNLVMEISLPDGRWWCAVSRFADRADGYDYWIPDDRDEEQRILRLLGT